jgi:HSP20 family protein
MLTKLKDNWKVILTVTLGLVALCTLAFALEVRSDFAKAKSRRQGLTTLDPKLLAQAQPDKTDSAQTAPLHPLMAMPNLLDSLLPPLTGSLLPDPDLLLGGADDVQVETQADRLVISLSVPNLNEASIHIQVDSQYVQVSAEQEQVQEQKDASGNVISRSQSTSSYSTSFSLPEPVKPDGMKSHYENGQLVIEIPRLYKEA